MCKENPVKIIDDRIALALNGLPDSQEWRCAAIALFLERATQFAIGLPEELRAGVIAQQKDCLAQLEEIQPASH